jgi:hypothetical protein
MSLPRGLLSPIVEFRRYAMQPGRRDDLIDLFDAELVESQEAEGMALIGQFREVDEPDVFTWLRGFPSMSDRARSLERFYTGPVWKANREAANATMLDSTNVLLLRPARPDSAFCLDGERAPLDSRASPAGTVEATVLHVEPSVGERDVLSFFELAIADAIAAEGGRVLGYFMTEASKNTFPGLPVREGVNVFTFFTGYSDDGATRSGTWQTVEETPGLREADVIGLRPTSRSLLTAESAECPAMSLV